MPVRAVACPRRIAYAVLLALPLTAFAPVSAPPGTAARTVQQNATQRFLRMMSDHHQGLISMAQVAVRQAQDPRVKAMAQRMLADQSREQREMLDMLRRTYRDTHQPMVMPEHRAMTDSLARRTGDDFDREFQMLVITHHHEALDMVHRMRPGITRQDVRTMMTRMETAQRGEIREMLQMLGFPPSA